MHYIVYRVRNKLDGRIYIGAHVTDNLEDDYLGSGLVVRRAIKKYGVEHFEKTILFDYDNKEDMFKMERMLVDAHFVNQADTYNLRRGGRGGTSFKHIVTEETREKLRKANLGKRHSEESRKRISIGHKGQGLGRTIPDEIRAKISEANTGKTWSESTRQKMKVAHKGMTGRKHSEETKRKIREANKKTWANEELRKKLGEGRMGNQWGKGAKRTKEQRKHLSKVNRERAAKKRIDNEQYSHQLTLPGME